MRKPFLLLVIALLGLTAAAQTAPSQAKSGEQAAPAKPKACSEIPKDEAKMKKPSPPACTDTKFSDGKMITIEYSQPGMKGREVWGKLVPWDAVWRMGANEATSFVTDTDLDVGGTKVPAGSYTLDLLPQQNGPWKLIINKTTGNWGIPYPGAASDLARIDMKTSQIPNTVERFTMSLAPAKGSATTLSFEWEKTKASISIKEAR